MIVAWAPEFRLSRHVLSGIHLVVFAEVGVENLDPR